MLRFLSRNKKRREKGRCGFHMANSNPPDPRYGGPEGKNIPRARHRHPQYHQQQQQQQQHQQQHQQHHQQQHHQPHGGNQFTPPHVPPPIVGAAVGMGMPILISVVMTILILMLLRVYALRFWRGFLNWAAPSGRGREEDHVQVQSPRSRGRKL